MKNKYLTKYLCITLAATMMLSNPLFVLAEEDAAGEYIVAESVIPEVQEPAAPSEPVSPAETPAPEISVLEETAPEQSLPEENISVPEESTPTPEPLLPEENVSTPEPEENPGHEETPDQEPEFPSDGDIETPIDPETPEEGNSSEKEELEEPEEIVSTEKEEILESDVKPDASPTPAPSDAKSDEWIKEFIDRIAKLAAEEKIVVEVHGAEIKALREEYDKLSEKDKAKITNYEDFLKVEEKYKEAEKIQLAESYPMNLHEGSPFDVSSLSSIYHLTFSENFAEVMTAIEREYLLANEITDGSNSASVTTSADKFLVRNWQDIAAVYIWQQHKNGVTDFRLDEKSKQDLAVIFAELNPVLTDKNDKQKKAYGNYHIDWYIQKYELEEEDQKFLKKYLETNCKLLCASATGAKGFVRQSIGSKIAEERVDMLSAAYSILGKVRYFWGGKSTVIGWDSRWGTPMTVTAPGSKSTGTVRYFGLDCSGFVTWAAVNAFRSTGMEGEVGVGTSSQWAASYMIEESQAQPGDFVFQRGPEAESNNHVGILCGKTDNGDWLVVHCNGRYNTITVDEAYGSGFRYIRRPAIYPSQDTVDWLMTQNQIEPEEIQTVIPDNELMQPDEENPVRVELPDSELSQPNEEKPSNGPIDFEWIDENFIFEDLSQSREEMNQNMSGETQIAEEIEMEWKEQAEEIDYTIFAETAEEVTLIAPDGVDMSIFYDTPFDFDTDAFRWTIEPEKKETLVFVDSSSEFFVGPLKPDVIPTFGPEQKEEPEVFGPELPEEIRVEVNEYTMAEEYEMK